MPETTKRTPEVIEDELKKVEDELKKFKKELEEKGWKTMQDKEILKGLEEQRNNLKEELKNVKEGVSSDSNEKFWENDVNGALEYLKQVKDKKWSELSKDGIKWISAVQVVLKSKKYDVWTVDWILGRKRSKTRAAVKKFQRDAGLKLVDGKPWPQTINAILWSWNDKPEEKVDGERVQKTDSKWNKIDCIYKDGKPWSWTVESNDGYIYTYEEWSIKKKEKKPEDKPNSREVKIYQEEPKQESGGREVKLEAPDN